ncbi:MAG: hypothetical protein JJU00_17260 [Opitutales bacterium]|nr:hypothetical protein [Opitutales bacterium]
MKKMLLVAVLLSYTCASFAQQTPPPWEEDDRWDDHHGHYGEYYDSPDSAVGLTDGTPRSTTAAAAAEMAMLGAFIGTDDVVDQFEEDLPAEIAETAAETTGMSALDLDVGFGSSKVDGVDFDFYTVRIPYSRRMSERGVLNFVAPLSITRAKDVVTGADGVSTGNASIYGGGVAAAYSHHVFIKADGKPYRWKVTPAAGIFLRESSDLNQGAWVYNTGLSSSFAYRLDEHWVVNVGNSLSLAWNSGRKDYPDPVRDNQQVLTNGVQMFYLAGRWTHHGYIMDTRFLRSSLVDNFQTYGVGTGYRITRGRSLKATIVYENGKHYEAIRAMIGTSWKF